MPIVESEVALLRHPPLRALATSARPAWLWSADASRILWTNAVGAAVFGAASPAALGARRFEAGDKAAAQVLRLAATLPAAGQERLERLRGLGAGFGRALTCVCSRFIAARGDAAILVVAAEPARPALPLAERVRRLFDSTATPQAAFAADGTLVYASESARACFSETLALAPLGLEDSAATALESGSASATVRCGDASLAASIERYGTDDSRVLLVRFAALPDAAAAPAEVATTAAAAAPPEPAGNEVLPERRHPLRFVWQMDAAGRFVVGSDEFVALVGPRTMSSFGRLWSEVAVELALDPDHQVARAVATRETWSGITVQWPVDELSEGLSVELSGLPVFDRERTFRGYRGFGVCRDIARINELARVRRERPIGFMPAAEPAPAVVAAAAALEQSARAAPAQTALAASRTDAVAEPAFAAARAATDAQAETEQPPQGLAAAAPNVVPFRPGPQQDPRAESKTEPKTEPKAEPKAEPKTELKTEPKTEPKTPSLSPVEHTAFRELAEELSARLRGPQPGADTAKSLLEDPLAAAAAAVLAAAAQPDDGAEAKRDLAGERALGAATGEIRELKAILDVATDAVLVLDRDGMVVSANDSARSLFGRAAGAFEGCAFGALFAAESEGAVREHFDRVARATTVRAEALDVEARGTDGRPMALAMKLARIGEDRFCAVFHDAGARKTIEEELHAARREVQKATALKAEFLAKVSHEIRTPLNAITGFAEVIMAERFGPIGNERYREYLKDIHAAGIHLVSLLNDLLDLSRIETGQLDLKFASVNLNDLTQQCVAIMQPQANRARIIIRTSLTPALPPVVADERSLRQIVLNLLSNSIRFTGPGGQVIVSTAFSDTSEAVLRVRDTGVGMSETDLAAALEPFRQTATAGSWGSGGAGFGLPLTKALAEANRAHFSIKSAPNAGTLVEVAFPPPRAAAG